MAVAQRAAIQKQLEQARRELDAVQVGGSGLQVQRERGDLPLAETDHRGSSSRPNDDGSLLPINWRMTSREFSYAPDAREKLYLGFIRDPSTLKCQQMNS